jgi:hypothetical protein
MKVCGFSFIRNGLKYDYPIIEAIKSILPICDEFIVAVGYSEDGTRELIESIAPDKIKIIDTVWDDSLREGGHVLAVETDKAFKAISADADWAIYIQGDEVIHEKYLPIIKQGMEDFQDSEDVDGLLLKYRHFYGSYDYVGSSANWYRHEIRVIKNKSKIYSYRDAQGFRKGDNEKLIVQPIDAYVYHYGWVKEPKAMQRKQENFHKLWHSDEKVKEMVADADEFDYLKDINELKKFEETHPKVMQERIDRINWTFDYDISMDKFSIKDRFKNFMYFNFHIDLGYKNYHLARGAKKKYI